ncbi:hypothetical protein U9M48_018194 [Paspalum notatum var. saurae]|uniref:Uncharacterized protein n=1 Tax=Paspalum notatum var. saurae TaxID=547442 RepID=A0AAQ3T8Z7_PASNO
MPCGAATAGSYGRCISRPHHPSSNESRHIAAAASPVPIARLQFWVRNAAIPMPCCAPLRVAAASIVPRRRGGKRRAVAEPEYLTNATPFIIPAPNCMRLGVSMAWYPHVCTDAIGDFYSLLSYQIKTTRTGKE